MTRKSRRELEHDVDKLRDEQPTGGSDGPEVSVRWREADPEARPTGMTWDPPGDEDEAATLTYDVWPAQRDTLDTLNSGEVDLTAFLSGYGAGKSILGSRWLIANALEYPGSRFLALGVDFQKARGTTFDTLFSQLPGERTDIVTTGFNGPENSPVVEDYNQTEHRLTLINDTKIILGSASEWSRYAGLEVGGVWMDEAAHYGDELFDLLEMLGGRLRGVDGPKQMLMTTTAAGYNAAYYLLEEREDKNGEPIGLDIELIRASTLDNPYLDPTDKERFKRQYEGTGREAQALHGGFSAGTGMVYPQFDREVHVIEHDEARDLAADAEFSYAYDAGFRHARVVLAAAVTGDGQIVVVDEYYKHGSHVEDAIRWMDGLPQGVIYAEHEPSDIRKFDAYGWYAVKADKSIDAGIAEVRRRLREDPETGQVGLLVSDRCENLIREFDGYKEEDVGTSRAVDDALDALRYLCMGEADDGGGSSWSSSEYGLTEFVDRASGRHSAAGTPFGFGGRP